jgi:proline iminopeptidase
MLSIDRLSRRVTTALALIASTSCSGAPAPEEGYLSMNGASIFYRSKGAGDPIVVLHGGPGFDHRQFLPFIWELADRHRVILYDQRGTGLSSCPIDTTSISIDTFVADIEEIRKSFGIERINLLGHSWGGILAKYYGIRHPDRLRSLILCSTTASKDSFAEMRATYEAARLPEDAELLKEIVASDEYKHQDPQAIEKFWRVFFKPYFPDQSLVSEMDLLFTENTIRNGNAVADHLFQSIGEFNLHEDLASITSPTLVIHGDSDPLPVECAHRIHRSIKDSELVIVPNSGHWLFVDATETFRSSILDFLARIDRD